MKHAIVLSLCFLPLAAIYIIMKISLLFSSSVDEFKYVEQQSKLPHGPYLANAYEDVDEEEEEYGSRTDYR